MVKSSHSLIELIHRAFELGVCDAGVIPAQSVVVEDRFAEMCSTSQYQCPGYGRSPHCPPHGMKPGEFRNILTRYEHVLVFKIDTPTEVLLDDRRFDVAKLIHEISAGLERSATEKGFTNSQGFAAGSCKMIFCRDQEKCVVLEKNENCRFPDKARPSLSGLGVNFLELSETIGWQFNKITKDTSPDDVSMGMMAGIVLIG
jgi:predicted metal-binding protein